MIPEGFFEGDKRALAKLLTMIEDGSIDYEQFYSEISPRMGMAHIIGITGAPGVGKSSLIGALIKEARKEGKKVGAILIDPTSPFTGGSLLGDRIRIQELATDDAVFIRSFASRNSKGGLFKEVRMAVDAMDAFGFDYIFVESVGVGQAECEIYEVAHTTLVLISPFGGDYVQIMKSGIMEIGDIFVITKSDLGNCELMKSFVEKEISSKEGWKKVICTSLQPPKGIEDVYLAIKEHRDVASKNYGIKVKWSIISAMRSILEDMLDNIDEEKINSAVREVMEGRMSVYSAAKKILREEGIEYAR